MKNSMLFIGLIMLGLFPSYLYSQDIELPTVEIKGHQNKIPPKVLKAFLKDFGVGHKPVEWIDGSTMFIIASGENSFYPGNTFIDWYTFHASNPKGWTLDANYTPEGKLISSQEYLKNFRPDIDAIMALGTSDFRDWRLIKDFHTINVYPSGSVKERYGLVVQKGKKKKTIYFNQNSGMLVNTKKEPAIAGL